MLSLSSLTYSLFFKKEEGKRNYIQRYIYISNNNAQSTYQIDLARNDFESHRMTVPERKKGLAIPILPLASGAFTLIELKGIPL